MDTIVTLDGVRKTWKAKQRLSQKAASEHEKGRHEIDQVRKQGKRIMATGGNLAYAGEVDNGRATQRSRVIAQV